MLTIHKFFKFNIKLKIGKKDYEITFPALKPDKISEDTKQYNGRSDLDI